MAESISASSRSAWISPERSRTSARHTSSSSASSCSESRFRLVATPKYRSRVAAATSKNDAVEYQAVKRSASEVPSLFRALQNITYTSYRADQLLGEGIVQLRPQPPHTHVHDVHITAK